MLYLHDEYNYKRCFKPCKAVFYTLPHCFMRLPFNKIDVC